MTTPIAVYNSLRSLGASPEAGKPEVVYGRLLEAVHISGYSFERACAELEWLLDEDRWKSISGIGDIDTFLAAINLSGLRIAVEQRRKIAARLHAIRASQHATAKMLGVNQATVSRDLNADANASLVDREPAETEAILAADYANALPSSENPSEINAANAPDGANGPDAERDRYSVAQWSALEAQERRRLIESAVGKSQFNLQETDSIEWARWSWNPVTGCLHNCAYCYARDIATVGPTAGGFPNGFEPTFLPYRLTAPGNTRVPDRAAHEIGLRNVFVCSMADLFGKWVPDDWISAVFDQVRANPQWNFLFLTKFPQRLAERQWPANAWCGTTVDTQARVKIAERAFRDVKAGVRWLSVEPMMERLTFSSLEMFNWIVVGGATRSTQTSAFDPPMEWVVHLLDQARAAGIDQVYAKANLKALRGYPTKAFDEVPKAEAAE